MPTHRITTHNANVVVSAQHGAGETFQNNAESTGRDIEMAGLEPDTIGIRHPPTVVRYVLLLPETSTRMPHAAGLLDISGRKVMDLKPGPNSVRALAPGVYFVREAQAQAQAQAIRKVVVTR